NLMTPDMNAASVHHTDREWRFHDVDLTPFVQNDSVTLKWEIDSDQGLHMGGWTLDALCVVGVVDAPPPTGCGDGTVQPPETCDDGNKVDGDGCSAACQDEAAATTGGDDTGGATNDDAGTDEGSGGGPGDTGGDTCSDGVGPGCGPTDSGDVPTGGADSSSGDDTGSGSDTAGGVDDEGCGCAQQSRGAPGLALAGLALLALRRRRR
ncbi:MAG: DUF4215 domain-containing protein, partial [Bryobacterales bacterium]|nr:DUF4215 domain-containing protein [Bryobacterales bacterium]